MGVRLKSKWKRRLEDYVVYESPLCQFNITYCFFRFIVPRVTLLHLGFIDSKSTDSSVLHDQGLFNQNLTLSWFQVVRVVDFGLPK